MVDEKEEQDQRFKVSDRRKFTEEGELRPSAEAETPSEEPSPPTTDLKTPQEQDPKPTSEEAAGTAMNFSSFLLSLATTGMVHLGEIADPVTGQKVANLDAAKQMIEILSILKEKTNGNLSADEVRLLDSLLYELQMNFVNKSKTVQLE